MTMSMVMVVTMRKTGWGGRAEEGVVEEERGIPAVKRGGGAARKAW